MALGIKTEIYSNSVGYGGTPQAMHGDGIVVKLYKEHEELELKSKAELKVLVKKLFSEEVEKLKLTSGEHGGKDDDAVRKMLTEVLIDNARLRKQINSVLRCFLSGHEISVREAGGEEEKGLLALNFRL